MSRYTVGIDLGSRTTKAVLLDIDRLEVTGSFVADSTVNPKENASSILDHLLDSCGITKDKVSHITATGYGRYMPDFCDKVATEITCHAKGVSALYPNIKTIIDIGGQDSKAIFLDDTSRVADFIMNDRCAAGTGRFLEVVAKILETDVDGLSELSVSAKDLVEISSMCVVFAESEVIGMLSRGVRREDIAAGIHQAISKRIAGIAERGRATPPIAFTGGVAKNLAMIHALSSQLEERLIVPSDPRITGALGAAIISAGEIGVKVQSLSDSAIPTTRDKVASRGKTPSVVSYACECDCAEDTPGRQSDCCSNDDIVGDKTNCDTVTKNHESCDCACSDLGENHVSESGISSCCCEEQKTGSEPGGGACYDEASGKTSKFTCCDSTHENIPKSACCESSSCETSVSSCCDTNPCESSKPNCCDSKPVDASQSTCCESKTQNTCCESEKPSSCCEDENKNACCGDEKPSTCCQQEQPQSLHSVPALARFDRMVSNCIEYATNAKKEGKKVISMFCEYTPRELIIAAGAVPVCACGGSHTMATASERDLPANLCPLIKSSYGFFTEHANPIFEMSDLVVAETTCDGKKKMYELMGKTKPMHILELTQKPDDTEAFAHWLSEIKKLKEKLEEVTGNKITDEKLLDAIRLMNRERSLRLELASFAGKTLSGRDVLEAKSLISGIECDHKAYKDIIDQSKESQNGKYSHKPRILMTGVPIPHGAEKVIDIIETSGAVVVCQETCTGIKPLVENISTEGDLTENLARKYFKLPCSVMTPNSSRLELIDQMIETTKPQGVVDLVWQACHTYNIESELIAKHVKTRHKLPFLKIETDYSPSDSGQLRLRVDAFLSLMENR